MQLAHLMKPSTRRVSGVYVDVRRDCLNIRVRPSIT